MRLETEKLQVEIGVRRIVQRTDLVFGDGLLFGLVGPNGAGKTTLLRAMASLVRYRGRVSLDGVAMVSMAPRTRARRLAYLPQGHVAHWPLPARELVMLGRLPHRRFGAAPEPADEAAVARAMAMADVQPFAHRRVDRLSGGERARVMLARALAVEAQVLLVDEPTASLDPYHQLHIMEVLKRYAADGRVVIAVLHDLSLAARFCDQLLLMLEGSILASGTPAEVLSDALLGRAFRISVTRGNDDEHSILVPRACLD